MPERWSDADTHQALRDLEARLDRASAAAERLIQEAGEQAAARMRAAWEPSGSGQDKRDLELLLQVVRAVRDAVPPELAARLADALRELLLALRAVIDYAVERLEKARAEPVEVQDIPIF
jgi:hypothetical protein